MSDERRAKDAPAASIGACVTVTIDGQKAKVPTGTPLLEAARGLGIRIPTLCSHPELCAAGLCRVCLVEIEGQTGLQTACTWAVTAPIKVRTRSTRIEEARRHVVGLLMGSHDDDCLRCPQDGRCELQTLAREVGAQNLVPSRGPWPRHPIERPAAWLVRDRNRCILCRRCVRTCADLGRVGFLAAVDRGDRTRIETFVDQDGAADVCPDCRLCATRCPTGALQVVTRPPAA